MKPGSIVKCVFSIPLSALTEDFDYIKQVPEIKKEYTVKALTECSCCGEPLLTVEEFNAGTDPDGDEVAFPCDWFVELEIPPSISEDIKESLTRELVGIKNYQLN